MNILQCSKVRQQSEFNKNAGRKYYYSHIYLIISQSVLKTTISYVRLKSLCVDILRILLKDISYKIREETPSGKQINKQTNNIQCHFSTVVFRIFPFESYLPLLKGCLQVYSLQSDFLPCQEKFSFIWRKLPGLRKLYDKTIQRSRQINECLRTNSIFDWGENSWFDFKNLIHIWHLIFLGKIKLVQKFIHQNWQS